MPELLIKKSALHTAVKFTSFAFFAVLLSACVGTDTASIFEGVKNTQANPQTARIEQSTISPSSASQPTLQSTALSNTGNTPAIGFRSVPIASKLPSPVAATNFLPLDNAKSDTPNTLALRSLDDETSEQTSLQLATISTPVISPIEAAAQSRIPSLYQSISHGKCPAEWAPKPKRVEAKRISPGDQYYIEIRMRNTPLMPVGHTFIVYGNLDGNGEPTSERMAMLAPLGGYVGAGIAAAIPIPGVLTPYGDDCKIRPETAYRVSLNAQRYEKLLLALKKAKDGKPVYMLFAQNCNHFVQRMADAVGIKPPKNKYVPAVKYLYDMIEANEGIKIDTRSRSNIVSIGDRISPEANNQRAKNDI